MAKTLGTHSGYSITELLIGIVVIGSVQMAILSFMTHTQKVVAEDRVMASRNRIMANLLRIAGISASIRVSGLPTSTNTEPFKRCVWAGATWCDAEPDDIYEFNLYFPQVAVGPGGVMQSSGRAAGISAHPVLYNLRGEACDPDLPAANCHPDQYPITAYALFKPLCAPTWDYWYNFERDTTLYDPATGINTAVNVRSNWTTWMEKVPMSAADRLARKRILPQGLVQPASCYVAREIEVHIRLEPTPGQSATSASGSATFPPLTMKTYAALNEVRMSWDE